MNYIIKILFPFLSWYKEIKTSWKNDLISGILVAVILIPQSLAYSQMAGMPAHYGLYAGFIPVIFAALWGSSRYLATGPAIVISLLTLTTISTIAVPASREFITYAAILALMVSFIQVFMGITKLGNLVHFISQSVILGFVNAASIIIILSQIIEIFDLPIVTNQHYLIGLSNIFTNYHLINLESLLVGIVALVLMILGDKYFKKFPTFLVVVLISILLSKIFGYSGSVVGVVPAGLPNFAVPDLNVSILRLLLTSSFVVAIVSYVSSISIAKTISPLSHEHIDPNQELIGQGMANIGAAMSGTSAVSGSFSRSAINFSSGAKTGFSSVVTGLIMAVMLLFFTPVLYFLPKSVLAGVIIVSVLKLIDFKHLKKIWTNYKNDGLVVIISFFATFIFSPHLEYGVLIGIIFSLIMYAHRAHLTSIQIFKADDINYLNKNKLDFDEYPSNQKVLAIASNHSLVFINADQVNQEIMNALDSHDNVKYILFMSRGINFIDVTASEMLKQLISDLKKREIVFIMVRAQPRLLKFLRKVDLFEEIGEENIFIKVNQALKTIDEREAFNSKK